MFYIGKGSGGSRSRRFRPHYNEATDQFYWTKKDYMNDIKRRGLVPSDEIKDIRDQPSKPSYKPSQQARDMINGLNKDSSGKYIVGDRFKEQLKKMQTESIDKGKQIKKDLKGKINGSGN